MAKDEPDLELSLEDDQFNPDTVFMSDELIKRLDFSSYSTENRVKCVLLREESPDGINGFLKAYKRTENSVDLCVEILVSQVQECISSPPFTGFALFLEEKEIYKEEFVEPLEESARCIKAKDKIDFYISFSESNN